MKPSILTHEQLVQWLAAPHPAVFLKLDLRSDGTHIAAAPLADCAFIGCSMGTDLSGKAIEAGAAMTMGPHIE